jgi:metallophosphoesterase superfamily enzyme
MPWRISRASGQTEGQQKLAPFLQMNEEALVLADVELGLLVHLREKGSVTNSKDRRTDFYRLDRA